MRPRSHKNFSIAAALLRVTSPGGPGDPVHVLEPAWLTTVRCLPGRCTGGVAGLSPLNKLQVFFVRVVRLATVLTPRERAGRRENGRVNGGSGEPCDEPIFRCT